MRRHFTVVIEQDQDGIFLVECPQLKGCRSYGNTINEALGNIKEAIEVCLDDNKSFLDENIFVGVRDIEVATP